MIRAYLAGALLALLTPRLRCFQLCPHSKFPRIYLKTFSSRSDPTSTLENFLLTRFVGDFDNFNQVRADQAAGMGPQKGGGHEHIHCCVRKVSLRQNNALLALYYFDGSPSKLFRARCYTLHPPIKGERYDECAVMKLWRLPATVAAAAMNSAEQGAEAASASAQAELQRVGLDSCTELCGCEVYWRFDPEDPGLPQNRRMLAHMEGGGCSVESENSPGTFIRVEDELILEPEERGGGLLINDRGFDPLSGAIIYGNHRGVPYEMDRVISGGSLDWTLG